MISVVCVDDDEDIQSLYKNILGKRGFKLRVYSEGIEAIRGFIKEPADIVLLDLQMPGLSGIDTCNKLRKLPNGSRIPIIVVSSKDSEETIINTLSQGIDDYILKPFKPSELLAKVSYAIKRRQAGIKSQISLSFSDRYEIVRKIDDGGQTTVYYANDVSCRPPREFALKIFKMKNTDIPESQYKTMFLREAYEWSKLSHPNVVKLFDFGQSSGSYYLVLEYVNGMTLWDQVNESGPQDEQELIYIAHELVGALEHICQFNIVHRDMKPNNILLSFEGDVKLTDFGLAKQKQDSRMTIMNNVFKGTPDFVSPEQIEGKTNVDILSDIYSLGTTLYYAATAQYPFRGSTIIETLNNHFNIRPKSINSINSKISKKFSAIVDKMLAKDKKERYSVAGLRTELSKLLQND